MLRTRGRGTARRIEGGPVVGAVAVLILGSVVVGAKPPSGPGKVQFKSATYSVAENGGSVRIYVSRTGGSVGTASVGYATANGPATAGSDYTSKSGTLNWSNGDAADKSFDVPILNDGVYEGDETFKANLSGATGATLGGPSSATVTITDDETPLPGPAYSLAELKVSQGFTASYASDVNDRGQVVGDMRTASGGNHAVVWETPSAAPTDLDNGFGVSGAVAINNLGQVVGSYRDAAATEHPVLWIPDGQGGYEMMNLGIPYQASGWANDIKDSGVVVGGFEDADECWGFVVVPQDTDGDGQADTWFRDDDGDGVNDLMYVFQVSMVWSWTDAEAINDQGWVVGICDALFGDVDFSGSFLIIPDYTLPNPWFKDEDHDGLNDLAIPLLDGGYYSGNKMGVNNHGQMVVRSGHLFEVAEDRSVTETPLPPPTSAYRWLDSDMAINDAGQVVGTGRLSKPNSSSDPFLWQKDKGTMRLESLVTNMAGFSDLTWALGINSTGQIVGYGTTRAGVRGYLASPAGN